MVRGIAKGSRIFGKDVVNREQRSWDFLYETSTTRDPKYWPGDREEIGDSRRYVYAKATAAVTSTNYGLKYYAELSDGIAYTAPLQTELLNATSIYVDAGGAAAVAEDELRGAYVIIHTHHVHHNNQFCGVLGNTVADSNGYTTIYLDRPLKIALTTAFGVEVYPNPFDSVRCCGPASAGGAGTDLYSSVAGIPLVECAAANQYLWLQTWGPCWVNPQGSVGYTVTANRRGLVFDGEGSIICVDANTATTAQMQYAGYIINRESTGNGTGPPLVFLQIS